MTIFADIALMLDEDGCPSDVLINGQSVYVEDSSIDAEYEPYGLVRVNLTLLSERVRIYEHGHSPFDGESTPIFEAVAREYSPEYRTALDLYYAGQ